MNDHSAFLSYLGGASLQPAAEENTPAAGCVKSVVSYHHPSPHPQLPLELKSFSITGISIISIKFPPFLKLNDATV